MRFKLVLNWHKTFMIDLERTKNLSTLMDKSINLETFTQVLWDRVRGLTNSIEIINNSSCYLRIHYHRRSEIRQTQSISVLALI